MKTYRSLQLFTATFALAALATTGCAEKAKTDEAGLSSPKEIPSAVSAEPAPVQWIDLKDVTYDMRSQFFSGLTGLEERVDLQMSELTAKRAAMKSTDNTKDWDFAMKEMVDARSYLKSQREVLGKASPETWNQEKDKVGLAWARTQNAYSKVKASTTN